MQYIRTVTIFALDCKKIKRSPLITCDMLDFFVFCLEAAPKEKKV
jgi:hypothetical protein